VRLDAVVQFDRLQEDLFSLPPISGVINSGKPLEPLPMLNPTKHATWQELCTPELTRVIMERHGEDAGLFERWRGTHSVAASALVRSAARDTTSIAASPTWT